jgi:Fe-S cluster biogenesis protein NfuA
MDNNQKILDALETVRPFLNADGGDVELVSLESNKLTIKLVGACSTCSMSEMTLKAGIEEAVKNAVPEIEEVIAI